METFTIQSPDQKEESNPLIHPTVVVHPSAKIDEDVKIGPYCVIGEGVKVGSKTSIGAHVVIEFAEIGSACQIYPGAFIGTAPQDLKYRGERTKIMIGDGTIVRECATLNRGTARAGKTTIGKRCLIMAYAHVAHDSQIEDEVILANSVAVAGHVQIGMGAIIGGLSGIHQFVRIGKLAMVGAGSMVPMDVPPYCTVSGDRARIVGLNVEGMRRRHLSRSSIESLKRTSRKIFSSKSTLKQVIRSIRSEKSHSPETNEFLQFIQNSPRGICRPTHKAERSAPETW